MKALASRQQTPFIFIGGVDTVTVDPADMEAILIGVSFLLLLLGVLGHAVNAIGIVAEWVAVEAAPLVECWAAGLEFWGEVIRGVVYFASR